MAGLEFAFYCSFLLLLLSFHSFFLLCLFCLCLCVCLSRSPSLILATLSVCASMCVVAIRDLVFLGYFLLFFCLLSLFYFGFSICLSVSVSPPKNVSHFCLCLSMWQCMSFYFFSVVFPSVSFFLFPVHQSPSLMFATLSVCASIRVVAGRES